MWVFLYFVNTNVHVQIHIFGNIEIDQSSSKIIALIMTILTSLQECSQGSLERHSSGTWETIYLTLWHQFDHYCHPQILVIMNMVFNMNALCWDLSTPSSPLTPHPHISPIMLIIMIMILRIRCSSPFVDAHCAYMEGTYSKTHRHQCFDYPYHRFIIIIIIIITTITF